MKMLIGVLVLLASAAALATPAVGDYVKYNISVTPAGSTTAVTGTLEQQLMSFNATTNQYDQKNTTTITGGTATVQEGLVNAADLITDAGIAQILGNCSSFGGTSASAVLPDGSHTNGCAVPVDSTTEHSTYVVVKVPFGIFAADIVSKANGNHTIATLNSYKVGP